MKKYNLKLSIVIPVFNSKDCLGELVKRVDTVLGANVKSYEIIMVNDCSTDESWLGIEELSLIYKHLKGINLRKNFGQDNAIMAGLNYSQGDVIIIMDDDLQHDPEDIPKLIDGVKKGHDVCYAHFTSKKQSWPKNFGSWFNGKVANLILKKPKEIYLSPYKAVRKEVVDEIVKYDGPYPYIDGLIFRITRNITQVVAEHRKRLAGKGNYNIVRSVRVWLKLATNFSVFPLRIASFLGMLSAGFGFCMALYFVVMHYYGVDAPTGWPSLIVTLLFIGGIQLLTIGIVGEYVGRVFIQQSKGPQFIVKNVTKSEKE